MELVQFLVFRKYSNTRGEEVGRRVPAIIATGLGGILSLIYAAVFWLSTPF
jgi:hypothetical protein